MHSRTRIKSGPCCARFHRRRRRRRSRHCRAPLSLRPCPRTSSSSSKSSSITTLKELPDALSSLQLSNAPGRSVSIPSAGTPGAVAALLRLLLFTRPVQLLEESRGAIETTARQRSRALRRSHYLRMNVSETVKEGVLPGYCRSSIHRTRRLRRRMPLILGNGHAQSDSNQVWPLLCSLFRWVPCRHSRRQCCQLTVLSSMNC